MAHLAGVVVLLSLLVQAKDNPEYTHWSSFKPGSWVKIKMEGSMGDQKLEMTQTTKLLEVTPEKVVVEHKRSMKMAGQALPEQVEKDEVPAKKEKVEKILKESEEEIEVNGKKMKCKVLEMEDEQKAQLKFWVSKDVPGGIVKGDVKAPPTEKGAMKITALEWEKK